MIDPAKSPPDCPTCSVNIEPSPFPLFIPIKVLDWHVSLALPIFFGLPSYSFKDSSG